MNSPGKNIEVATLPEIFLTQDRTQISHIAGTDSLLSEPPASLKVE